MVTLASEESTTPLRIRTSSFFRLLISFPALFILGAVFGGLSVIAGLFILTSEQAHLFPLGVLAALLLIAVAWYKGQRKNAQRKQLMMEEETLRVELGELDVVFEGLAIEALGFSDCLGTLGEHFGQATAG